MAVLCFDVAVGEVGGESRKGVACEGADKDADYDVTEIVLAHEDAADCHHECPEEHPPSVSLEPFRHDGSDCCQTVLHSYECAEGQSEGIG